MTMTGSEVFKRTAVYDRDMSNIRLHAPQWKLLLAFDGQRSLSEIALSAVMPFSEALPLTENFLKQSWIEEQPITLEEYLKRASASGTYSGGVIPPSVIVREPAADSKVEKASAPPPTMMAIPTPATVALPVIAPPEPSREAARATTRGAMRLSAVVDYIISLADTLSLGQLLAYRVFLRVPPEILQSEDIVSIHLVDDTSLVRSEPLQKAIASAVQEVLKRNLPDSVFAPA